MIREAWGAPDGQREESLPSIGSSPATKRPPVKEVKAVSAGNSLRLAHLCHSVTAQHVEEKLLITLSDIQFDAHAHISAGDLRIKAYVGPVSVVSEAPTGRPDKNRLVEVRLDLHEGLAVAEVDCGVPHPPEPWCVRVKLYHRPASALFRQEQVAEVVESAGDGRGPADVWLAVPRCSSQVQLINAEHQAVVGTAVLRVLRCVPSTARQALEASVCSVLVRAVRSGVNLEEVAELCRGARELGPRSLARQQADEALQVASDMGSQPVVELLLEAGVQASMETVRRVERMGKLDLALSIFKHITAAEGQGRAPGLLPLAIDEKLPAIAERLLQDDPDVLEQLPAAGNASTRKAHAASAWTVLAALINRGDTLPAPPRQLLSYSLQVGHAALARALLSRNEGLEDMEKSLRTCLENGRVEIVREALEAQWRLRASQWTESTGPALLSLECGATSEPAECSVCFDALHTKPGVFLGPQDIRVCPHFLCLDCAEHVQDEAYNRHQRWRQRNDRRIPEPPGPVCPLCRAPFVSAVRFTDPTVDPRKFFRLACVPEDRESGGGGVQQLERHVSDLQLKEKIALGALTALLPVNPSTFEKKLENELWPSWCAKAQAARPSLGTPDQLVEDDFLRPGGMLAWVCDHLLELKVSEARGAPPRLEDDPSAWFHHFDYDGKGRLTKPELLRGVAKAYDVGALASPTTPARKKRTVGVQRLREIVEAVWDDYMWAGGVPLDHFEGSRGLAEKLLDVLPGGHRGRTLEDGTVVLEPALSVEEALSKARECDFSKLEEDAARLKEREEKKKAAAALPQQQRPNAHRLAQGPQRGNPQDRRQVGRAGGGAAGELLFMSVLAQRQGAHQTSIASIRIQCPSCGAINEVTAAAGYRVICGQCRQPFGVPNFNVS